MAKKIAEEVTAEPFALETEELPEVKPENSLTRLIAVCEKMYAKFGCDEYGQPRKSPIAVQFRAAIDECKKEFCVE